MYSAQVSSGNLLPQPLSSLKNEAAKLKGETNSFNERFEALTNSLATANCAFCVVEVHIFAASNKVPNQKNNGWKKRSKSSCCEDCFSQTIAMVQKITKCLMSCRVQREKKTFHWITAKTHFASGIGSWNCASHR